jgi:hypothetical protein
MKQKKHRLWIEFVSFTKLMNEFVRGHARLVKREPWHLGRVVFHWIIMPSQQ